ncbi:hypothetical protein DFH06DRAFT_1017021, partial [Mycena polygramma]
LPTEPVNPVQVPQLTARDHLHPQWYIRCTMYLAAFLHTRHRVTFRAAGLMLICLGFIFACLFGNLAAVVSVPRTLKTVFSRLEMTDNFTVHPVCFHCHYIFEPDIKPDTFCPDCEEEVFGAPTRDEWVDPDPVANTDSPGAEANGRKPQMVSPIQLLSTGLHEFFKRPGMVSAVESWRTRTSVDGELKCMQDARVWKEIKDGRGESFFYGATSEEEIRLGVSFSLDWYRTDNLILSGMTGLKEPTAEQLQPYLKIIVDDLLMLYDDGIVVKTPEYPDGMAAILVSNLSDQLNRETGARCTGTYYRGPSCDV